jgi:hypothetical protein
VERVVLVPLFVIATVAFLYANTIPGRVLDPLVQRLLALG